MVAFKGRKISAKTQLVELYCVAPVLIPDIITIDACRLTKLRRKAPNQAFFPVQSYLICYPVARLWRH